MRKTKINKQMTPIQPENPIDNAYMETGNPDKKMTAETTIPKCELSNEELISKLRNWNSKLCKTGGKAWVLKVPVDTNNDPDVLIEEICKRLEQTASIRKELEKEKRSHLNTIKIHTEIKKVTDLLAKRLIQSTEYGNIYYDGNIEALEKYNALNN